MRLFSLAVAVGGFLTLSGCALRMTTQNHLAVDEEIAKTEQATAADLSELGEIPAELRDLTIPYLRMQNYPGSVIAVEAVIQETGRYSSYYASYKSDGLKIYGQLTKPNTDMPAGGFPAVVFVHGYIPPLTYETFTKYVDYVDYLANNGIVVFKIDLRGHGESEGEAGGAYYSSGYVIDVLNAYSSLEKLDYVNTDNIGLWGHSMAGNVVTRALAVKPTIPKVVVWAGAVYTYLDMQTYGIDDGSYQPNQNPNRGKRQMIRELAGEPTEANVFWQKIAPSSYIADFTGQVQLHHAINDSVVTIEYSRNLKQLFDEAEGNIELFEYESGGHNLSDPAFAVAMKRTVDFYLE